MCSGCEPGIRYMSGQAFLPFCKLFLSFGSCSLCSTDTFFFNLLQFHLSILLLFPEMLVTNTGSCRRCRCPEVFPLCISITVSKSQALRIFMNHFESILVQGERQELFYMWVPAFPTPLPY